MNIKISELIRYVKHRNLSGAISIVTVSTKLKLRNLEQVPVANFLACVQI